MTADTETLVTSIDGRFASSQWWALLIVAVALLFVVLVIWLGGRKKQRQGLARSNGGLVTGLDNRRSTSKTVAVGWTLVVAWMVATDALIAVDSSHGITIAGLLKHAPDLYFVFLGGPYAAAAFAKASIQQKTADGTVAKIPADNPSTFDLIQDDAGNVDVYDFQYLLFNVLAIIIVVVGFSSAPGHGLPPVPPFLAILAGGAAATYTVNKALSTSGPRIISVTPPTARIGDTLMIVGVGMFDPNASATLPTVTVGGIQATKVDVVAGATNTISATIVDASSGVKLAGAVDIVVQPPQVSPLVARKAVTIVPDQPDLGQVPDTFKTGATISVTGKWLLAPGTADGAAPAGTTTVGGLTASLATEGGTAWPITFEGPYSNDLLTLKIGAPSQPPSNGTPATLTLVRSGITTPLVRATKYVT
jgi:hypothetical protein